MLRVTGNNESKYRRLKENQVIATEKNKKPQTLAQALYQYKTYLVSRDSLLSLFFNQIWHGSPCQESDNEDLQVEQKCLQWNEDLFF